MKPSTGLVQANQARVHTDPAIMANVVLDEFKFYPSLPIELRHKIIKIAIRVPRVIQVRFRGGYTPDYGKKEHRFYGPKLSLAHVNKEMRVEVLKEYKIAFDNQSALNKCYFNFDRDSLYFSSGLRSKFVHFSQIANVAADLQRLQNLTCDQGFFTREYDNFGCRSLFEILTSVKELHMAVTHCLEEPCINSGNYVCFYDLDDGGFQVGDSSTIREKHIELLAARLKTGKAQFEEFCTRWKGFDQGKGHKDAHGNERKAPAVVYKGMCYSNAGFSPITEG